MDWKKYKSYRFYDNDRFKKELEGMEKQEIIKTLLEIWEAQQEAENELIELAEYDE